MSLTQRSGAAVGQFVMAVVGQFLLAVDTSASLGTAAAPSEPMPSGASSSTAWASSSAGRVFTLALFDRVMQLAKAEQRP